MAEEITNVEETKTTEIKVKDKEVEEIKQKEIPKTPELDQETQEAIALYNSLKDPEKGKIVIEMLAKRAGLVPGEQPTKTEKKTITQRIKESLGEENSILADALGPALDQIISEAVQEKIHPITQSLQEERIQEFSSRIDATIEKLNTDTKGESKKLEKEMLKVMDKVNPSKGTSPEDYINMVYKIASGNTAEVERIKRTNEKQIENKKSTTGVQTGVNSERIKSGSKLPTIREAVLAASRGEKIEE